FAALSPEYNSPPSLLDALPIYLAERGTTVLLTTHYLDEADKLCDRISVIDRGRNLVEDTPTGLKRRIGNERLEVVAAEPGDLPRSEEHTSELQSHENLVCRLLL